MSLNTITRKIIIRYSLFQIPSLLIVTLLVFTVNHWYILDNAIIVMIILFWILKDILIFPFVWKAYSHKDRDKSKTILNQHGVAVDTINPKGFVKINGEIWQAELVELNDPINQGQPIEVVEIDGLKLKVRKCL